MICGTTAARPMVRTAEVKQKCEAGCTIGGLNAGRFVVQTMAFGLELPMSGTHAPNGHDPYRSQTAEAGTAPPPARNARWVPELFRRP